MAMLIKRLGDIEDELLRFRAGLAQDGEDKDPGEVIAGVFALASMLQDVAENYVIDLERKRGRSGKPAR